MALSLNTSHPLYAYLQNLICVDDDGVIKDLKNPGLTFTQDADAGGIIASRNYGRAFRVSKNGTYEGYGVTASASINVGTDDVTKTTVFIAYNGVFDAGSFGNLFGPSATFGQIHANGKVSARSDFGASGPETTTALTLSTIASPVAASIAIHREGDTATGGRVWINGAQDASSPFSNTGGALGWSSGGNAFTNINKGTGNGHTAADIVYIAIFKGFDPSNADISSLHSSLTGSNAFGLISSGSGASSLVVNDGAHVHVADNLALTIIGTLSIADATHAHAADSITLTATSNGTITIPAVRDWGTKALKTGQTGVQVDIRNITTGALVVRKTGQTTHATTGVCVVTDAAIVAGTTYEVVTRFADGSRGMWDYTAS